MIPALVSTLLAVGPCAPVEPKPPDAELASVYAAVAAEEEAQGATDAAAAAWRSSAELDPDAGVATHALTRLCREEQARVDFEAGLALFESGDCPAALPRLEAARVGVDAAPAALMVGICAYELSDEPRAIEALLVARALPALAATADLYLGLIALRGGEPTAAAARLRSVSLDPGEGLHSLASELLALTERRERLVIDGALEAGYDSNAPLAAFATVLPGGGDDAMGSASVNLSLRPLRANGPYLTVGGAYRKYLRFPSYDVGLVGGSLGGSLTLGRLSGSVD